MGDMSVEAIREMIDAVILVEEDGYAAMHSAMHEFMIANTQQRGGQ